MTTISITRENLGNSATNYSAAAGNLSSRGKTPGEALDALTAQMDEKETGTLVIVQQMQPDRFFTEPQQKRLAELMQRWRTARDNQSSLPAEEQAELDDLVQAELKAASERAAALVRQLNP